MKCGNCGHEFEKGIFCPECGTRYEAEKLMVEDAPQDKQSNDTNNNMNGGEDETSSVKKKVPWYVNGFFILIVFYFFKIPGVILCLIRLIKCKERRKITVITAILVLFIPYLTSAYKDTQIENNTSYQSKADYDNNISYQSEADYDKGSSKLSANGNFYTPITFPYKNKKASKLIDLYEKALEHQENLIYIQPDKVVRNHAYSYKQTIEWSEYLYYGDIKDGKPHGQGLIFKDSLIIYMGDFSKGSLNGYGIRFSEDSEIGIKYEGEWKDGQYNGDGIEYVGYDNDTVLNQIREYYDN